MNEVVVKANERVNCTLRSFVSIGTCQTWFEHLLYSTYDLLSIIIA